MAEPGALVGAVGPPPPAGGAFVPLGVVPDEVPGDVDVVDDIVADDVVDVRRGAAGSSPPDEQALATRTHGTIRAGSHRCIGGP